MKTLTRMLILGACLLAALTAQDSFQIKPGDRIVFYGDSITDQRLYTTFVETYILTRFPQREVGFVHSGWGGDRVTGGSGGGVQVRIPRDILAYRPTVVTIMLGMNDGRYRAFDDQIFAIYSGGYRQIVKRLKADLPGVRITAIQPSPYDDVTRAPGFPGGYNATLLRYADFIGELGAAEKLTVADLNRPVTAMLERAKSADAELAQKILPDRVHPGAAGHLIMAESLLKAWQAPAVVSEVEMEINDEAHSGRSENASVSVIRIADKTISWTQTERALPMPIDLTDPVMALAVHSSDVMDALNREMLKVAGLSGKYTLSIDDEEVATFSAAELAAGVNLAAFKTPMWAQAEKVHLLTLKHNNIHYARWRSVQFPLASEDLATIQPALSALDSVEADLVREQRAAAQPVAHKFELVPGESRYHSIFGDDLSGWHISQVNHHGNTQGWKVEAGIITGAQDKPGNGGIILTDRKYRDFEVSLELNPDYGCDSGLFLRSNEKGEAYQVLIDYLDGGAVGGVYGERLKDVKGFTPNWQEVWKSGQWNQLRARIEGEVPHIQVWLNGMKITDWRDTENHLTDGAKEGMIALQVHGGNRWIPKGKHRFRNIQVRELPSR